MGVQRQFSPATVALLARASQASASPFANWPLADIKTGVSRHFREAFEAGVTEVFATGWADDRIICAMEAALFLASKTLATLGEIAKEFDYPEAEIAAKIARFKKYEACKDKPASGSHLDIPEGNPYNYALAVAGKKGIEAALLATNTNLPGSVADFVFAGELGRMAPLNRTTDTAPQFHRRPIALAAE